MYKNKEQSHNVINIGMYVMCIITSEIFSLDILAALGNRNTNCDKKKNTKLVSMYK